MIKPKILLYFYTYLADFKQVLITGVDDQAQKMEVIQPNGKTTICQAISHKYPLDISSASGALVGITMVICDGKTSACYSFSNDNQWRNLSKMITPRRFSSAISVSDGIWVTGGRDSNRNVLDSSEFIFLNGTRAEGPDLPKPRYDHCVVFISRSPPWIAKLKLTALKNELHTKLMMPSCNSFVHSSILLSYKGVI